MSKSLSLWKGWIETPPTRPMGDVSKEVCDRMRVGLKDIRAGFGPNHIRSARRTLMAALADEGYLDKQIAHYLGCTRSNVSHARRGGYR